MFETERFTGLAGICAAVVLCAAGGNAGDASSSGAVFESARAGCWKQEGAGRPGRVVAWGDNGSGQCDVPESLTNAVAVSAGYRHTLAVTAEGLVIAWGSEDYGQCDVPESLSNVVAVSASCTHSVALKADGTVAAWGDNSRRACDVPRGLSNVVAVTTGADSTYALRADGTVAVWGDMSQAPAGMKPATALSAGACFALALHADGTVTAWGYDVHDEMAKFLSARSNIVGMAAASDGVVVLEDDGTVSAWVNHAIGTGIPSGLSDVVAVSAGGAHFLALKADGSLAAWGNTTDGQCEVPVGLPLAVSFDGGALHSVAIVSEAVALPVFAPASGAVIPQGGNREVSITCVTEGAEIRYTLDGASPTATSPLYVAPLILRDTTVLRARAFAPGLAPSGIAKGCYTKLPGMAAPGTVRVFGANWAGQCDVPAGLTNVMAIAAGYAFTVALKTDGTVVAWGDNERGLCDVSANLSNVVAVSAGDYHTLALKADGSVVAWGDDDFGQCDVPEGLSDVVAVSAGYFYSLALKNDGTVIGWGQDWWGQRTPPAGLSDVVAIAAGGMHSLALKADGTVVAWGDNEHRQRTVPADLANVVAVTAGAYYSAALQSDGTVIQWGWDWDGAFAVPAGLGHVVALSGGKKDGLVALKSDGTVVAWSIPYDDSGRYDFPVDLEPVVAVAAGQTHTAVLVSEAVGDPHLAVDPVGQTVAAMSGTARFVVTNTGDGVRWTASVVSGEWARVVSGGLGVNEGVVTVAYDANAEGQPVRQAVVRVTAPGSGHGAQVTLTQAAATTASLEEYVAMEPSGVPFRTAGGAWYHSDVEGTDAIRSVVPPKGGAAVLSATVQGPGLLAVDWKLQGTTKDCRGSLTMALASKTVETCTATGDFERVTLAVPSGVQNVAWTVGRAADAGEVCGWLKRASWQPLSPVPAASPVPRDGSALRNARVDRLAWGEVALPSGGAGGYRLYAAARLSPLPLVCEGSEAFAPRSRVAMLLPASDARPLYWRVDTFVKDGAGREAVAKGSVWRFTAVSDEAPQFLWPAAGGSSEAEPADSFPPVTLYAGVAYTLGPFAVEASSAAARLGVKADGLPAGLRAGVTGDFGVTLSGVASASAAGGAGYTYRTVMRLSERLDGQTRLGATVEMPVTVLPLGQACGAFTGYIDDGGYRRGLAWMTIQPGGKISGRVKVGAVSYTFSAPSYGGITKGLFFAHMIAKADHAATPRQCPFDLEVSTNGVVTCSFDGCVGVLHLERNRWKEPGMARLAKERFEGYYTVALLPGEGVANAAKPTGAGYLTLTVSSAGAVSAVGVLADGIPVSGATTLLFDDAADIAWIPVYLVPSAYRHAGSGVFVILEVASGATTENDPVGRTLNSVSGSGVWANRDPLCVVGYDTGLASNQVGFSEEIVAGGGFYDRAQNLQAYYAGRPLVFSAPAPFAGPFDWAGADGASGFLLGPSPRDVAVSVLQPSLSVLNLVPAPRAVVSVPGTRLTDFAASTNPWNVRLSAARATGVINGRFDLVFANVAAGLQKRRTVALKGILIPHADGTWGCGDQAAGFYLIPDAGAYTDERGNRQTYPFNWSGAFRLLP